MSWIRQDTTVSTSFKAGSAKQVAAHSRHWREALLVRSKLLICCKAIVFSICCYTTIVYAQTQAKLHESTINYSSGTPQVSSGALVALNAINNNLRYPLLNLYRITSPFGWRFHPVRKIRKHHDGIDIGAPQGVPVLAAMSGTVVFSAYTEGGGNQIGLEHSGNYRTWYVHLSKRLVTLGQQVEQGDVIGYVGATGRLVTGPHLHFAVQRRDSGKWNFVDPIAYLGRTMPVPTTPFPPSADDTAFTEDVPRCDDVLWGQCKSEPLPTLEPLQNCDNTLWGECKQVDKKY